MRSTVLKWGWVLAVVATFSLQGITWFPAVTISEQGELGAPASVVDNQGNVTVVWYNFSTGFIRAVRKPYGGNWQLPVSISTPFFLSEDPFPQLAVDPLGNVTVVWTTSSINLFIAGQIESNQYLINGGGWQAPAQVTNGIPELVGQQQVAVDSAGNATATWINSTSNFVQASTKLFNAPSWGTVSNISVTSASVTSPQIALDNNGLATVIWEVNATNDLFSSTQTAIGTWPGTSQIVATLSLLEKIAFNPANNSMTAIFTTEVGSQTFIKASTRPVGTLTWPMAVNVSKGATINLFVDLVIDRFGNSTVAWETDSSSPPNPPVQIQAATRFAGQTAWTNLTTFLPSTPFLMPDVQSLGVDHEGHVVLIWTAGGSIQSNVFTLGSGWGTVTPVFESTNPLFPLSLAVDPAGEATAVWRNNNGSASTIMAASSGPGITSLKPDHGDAHGGNQIEIIGDGFINVTSVTFGGIPAKFKVVSQNLIIATVPPGTPKETVEVIVTTPVGSSAPAFYTYNALIPPLDVQGKQIDDRFATQEVFINQLTWVKSPDPAVVAYLIFRDGKLVAKIPQSSAPKFDDQNRPLQVAVYTIFAIDAKGNRSKGVKVSIPKEVK